MVASGIDCGECAMCKAGLQILCDHKDGGLVGGTTNLYGARLTKPHGVVSTVAVFAEPISYEVFGNQQDGCVKWLVTPYVE